ncbi:MAG: hypothetical protein K1X78_14760 [Verrucomicrobiaceae bacterium]|nr:hypothetical protein [Verrucomicrobiaceae bacterium]
MNADSSTSPGNQGKWLRFGLVAFPVGLVLLGAASFWFYFDNKAKKEKHTYRHALALRRDVDTASLSRYLAILGDAAKLSPEERRQTVSSFVQSTLGPENMGYDLKKAVETDRGTERASYHASLDGSRRPSDVVLVLAGYGDAQTSDDAALSVLFSVAQAMTGTPRVKTVRFAVLDASTGGIRPPFERMDYDMRKSGDRVVHLVALGPSARVLADEWSRSPGAGTVTIDLLPFQTADELKTRADAVLKVVVDAADRL